MGGTIRKLWPSETEKFKDHLLRLDQASRRTRFAHAVSDSFIEDYATHMTEMGSLIYAYLEDGEVRRLRLVLHTEIKAVRIVSFYPREPSLLVPLELFLET